MKTDLVWLHLELHLYPAHPGFRRKVGLGMFSHMAVYKHYKQTKYFKNATIFLVSYKKTLIMESPQISELIRLSVCHGILITSTWIRQEKLTLKREQMLNYPVFQIKTFNGKQIINEEIFANWPSCVRPKNCLPYFFFSRLTLVVDFI